MTKKTKTSSQKKTKKQTATINFRSKFEETVAEALGECCPDYEYETLRIPYVVERNYNPDFILPNGIILKLKVISNLLTSGNTSSSKSNTRKDIRFVFQKASVRVQGSKLTCAEWCERYGFLYAEGKVPEEWTRRKTKMAKRQDTDHIIIHCSATPRLWMWVRRRLTSGIDSVAGEKSDTTMSSPAMATSKRARAG